MRNLLLEPLALQVTQLLGTRTHDIVRWGDISSRLSKRPDTSVFFILCRSVEHRLTSRHSPASPAGLVGGAPLMRGQPPSDLSCHQRWRWRDVCWSGGRPTAVLALLRPLRQWESDQKRPLGVC